MGGKKRIDPLMLAVLAALFVILADICALVITIDAFNNRDKKTEAEGLPLIVDRLIL